MRSAVVQTRPVLGRSLVWLMTTACLISLPGSESIAAPAGAYKTLEAEIDPVYSTAKELRDRGSKVRSILSGTLALSGNETQFDEYYTRYLFPGWTLTTEANLGSLAKDRERFLTELAKSNPQVHDRLVDLTFNFMTRIAKDPDLHPGARYNAVYVLGALNAKEPDRSPNNKLNPEPLPKALPELVGLFKDPAQPDAIKVAALLGILRHLEWDEYRKQTPRMAPADKADIVKELTALAEASEAPEGRSAEGHTWMRRRAVEGLMYAAIPGTTREIAGVIEKLISNVDEPIALRCTAADIMGRLEYKDPVIPPPRPSALELGYLALVACNTELTRLEDKQKQDEMRAKSQTRFSGIAGGLGGGLGGAAVPGFGGGGGAVPGASGPRGGPGMMSPGMPGMGAKGAAASGPPNMAGKMGPTGMMAPKGKGKQKAKATPEPQMPLDMLGGGGNLLDSQEPVSHHLDGARRRMRAWLFAVQMGLGDEANPGTTKSRTFTGGKANTIVTPTRGVAAYAKNEQDKTYVADVTTKVQNLIRVVEDPEMDQDEFVVTVRERMKELEAVTKPLEQPKAEPAPADDVPGAVPGGRAAAAAPAAEAPDDASVPAGVDVPAAPARPAAATEVPAAVPTPAEGGGNAPSPAPAPATGPPAAKSP